MPIYILRSGPHCKIGISDNVQKRLTAYNTHNPSYEVVRVFECERGLSREIESAVRREFADRTAGGGREWFTVESRELEQAVEQRLRAAGALKEGAPLATPPGHHAVPLPYTVQDRLAEIANLLSADKHDNAAINRLQQKVLREFSQAFDLGTFEYDLGDDGVRKLGPGVCHEHCSLTYSAMSSLEEIRFPRQDHIHRFYDVVPTASGHKIAVCRAIVSMPYSKDLASPSLLIESAEYSSKIGWSAVAHPEWSWHWPGRTQLYLFQAKLPRAEFARRWANSFKRWVVENERRLQSVRAANQELFNRAIENIRGDASFPLHVTTFSEFTDYTSNRFPFTTSESYDDKRQESLYLFNLWRAELGLLPDTDPVPEQRAQEAGLDAND